MGDPCAARPPCSHNEPSLDKLLMLPLVTSWGQLSLGASQSCAIFTGLSLSSVSGRLERARAPALVSMGSQHSCFTWVGVEGQTAKYHGENSLPQVALNPPSQEEHPTLPQTCWGKP